MERNEVLVSYDVKNLYPSIPIPEALELVDVLLKSKANLLDTPEYPVNHGTDALDLQTFILRIWR